MADDISSILSKVVGLPKKTAAGTKGIPDEGSLAKMSWEELLNMRRNPKLTREDHNTIAPYEHRAYARENSTNPLEAMKLAIGSVGYTPVKAITGGSRSDPSLAEMVQGLTGVWEGVKGLSGSKDPAPVPYSEASTSSDQKAKS